MKWQVLDLDDLDKQPRYEALFAVLALARHVHLISCSASATPQSREHSHSAALVPQEAGVAYE